MAAHSNQSLTPFGTGSRRGRWQTACERLLHSLLNWWATHSPFALERDLVQGPIQPSKVAALYIGAVLLVVLVGVIGGGLVVAHG